MAIEKIPHEDTDRLDVSINNGDLRAINEIKEKMNFKDQASVIRFALAALKVASDEGELSVLKKDGSTKSLKPIDDLLSEK